MGESNSPTLLSDPQEPKRTDAPKVRLSALLQFQVPPGEKYYFPLFLFPGLFFTKEKASAGRYMAALSIQHDSFIANIIIFSKTDKKAKT